MYFQKKYSLFSVALVIIMSCKPPLKKDHNALVEMIIKSKDSLIQKILSNKSAHEIQVLYTQIKRDAKGNPHFKELAFQENSKQYFYPASVIKLPVAILALEKIRNLQSQGIDISPQSPFKIYGENQKTIVAIDSTHPEGKLSISHLIKKLFLVSDNQAYNYLYDFLGRDLINKSLKDKGIEDMQIYHKFSGVDNNDKSPNFVFFSEEGDIIYNQPENFSEMKLKSENIFGYRKGKAFVKEDQLIETPMDFSKKNYASLSALNQILKRVIFPLEYSRKQRFQINEDDYEFIKYWMSRVPTEVEIPLYDREYYYDSYCKFLMYGDLRGEMTDSIRIYNKAGLAYGTLTDLAYIKDNNGVEFFLAATVLVNQNEIFNDGEYQYEDLGIPFLGALGRTVYEFERKNLFKYHK
tara:strand:- start:794 stop:2020 length:1227 start_codon:yes stop_codon:yes gene_type:complete